jgi:predicted 3-demethylubiquinone-9 3-methyltransferase (glyoxalase superfamily)
MMKLFTPTFYFGGKHYGAAYAAAQLYATLFPLTQICSVQVMSDDMRQPAVVHRVELVLGGWPLVLADDAMTWSAEMAPMVLTVVCESEAEYFLLKEALSPLEELGQSLREDDEMLWTIFNDHFGVQWELVYRAA